MKDLTTSYMGLTLRNPIIVASSDLTRDFQGIKKCAEAGAGAVVIKSIFEEQFLLAEYEEKSESLLYSEVLDYLRSGSLLEYAPQKVVEIIENAKKEVDIPVIASINCQTPKLWPRFARQIQDAGADGLELNIYKLPISVTQPGRDYEEEHVRIIHEVKKEVTIPVSVKITCQFTSIPHLAQELAEAGCEALVFFNWFLEPDINIKNLKTKSLRGKGNFHQSLRWVALLAGRIKCDIGASGGVNNAEDCIKQILAGASAVQVCTLFYQKGLGEIQNLLKGLEAWMDKQRYSCIDDFKGELSFKSQKASFRDLGEAESYFRAQYLKAYTDFNG